MPQSSDKKAIFYWINECGQVANAGMFRYREESELLNFISQNFSIRKYLLVSDCSYIIQVKPLKFLMLPGKNVWTDVT